MKKLLYAAIGSLLYIAPLVGLYLQIIGGRAMRVELEGIRKAIENLQPKEKHELGRIYIGCWPRLLCGYGY